MKSLTPAELMALTTPRPCIRCHQDLALAGKGSNYCKGCNPETDPRFEEESNPETDWSALEHDERAGADVFAPWSTDFRRGE